MTQEIKTERRWLRSVIAASVDPLPVFPWMRGQRKRPGSVTGEDVPPAQDDTQIGLFRRPGAIAAH